MKTGPSVKGRIEVKMSVSSSGTITPPPTPAVEAMFNAEEHVRRPRLLVDKKSKAIIT